MGEKRDPFAQVGAAERYATHRAKLGGATYRDLAILNAVVCAIGSYSWTRLRSISVGTIAFWLGKWDGHGDCPKPIENAIGSRLKFLDECGAIIYIPGGQKDGPKVSKIGYRPPAEIAGGDDPRPPAEIAGGKTAGTDPTARDSVDDPPRISVPTPRDSVEKQALTPRENRGGNEDLRGDFRGGVREARADSANNSTTAGRTADRLTSLASADLDRDQMKHEARRVVDIIAPVVDLGILVEWLDEDPSLTNVRPFWLLAMFVEALMNDEDPTTRTAGASLEPALLRLRAAIDIADATAAKTGRTDHLEEAVDVVEHWHRHNVPKHVTARAIERAEADGLTRPGLADAHVRAELDGLGLGHTHEKYVMPPATKQKR